MTDKEWCDKLEPEGMTEGVAMKWRFHFLTLIRRLEVVDKAIAIRAAHIAARTVGLYTN